ncbi:MAG TPA: hypothetical protein VM869_10765 [Enhygromyxa sp.]|nr:hypothetical protein [Enhygromyxa sp.]
MPKIKERYKILVGKDFQRYHMALDVNSALEKTESRTFGETNKAPDSNTVLIMTVPELRGAIGDMDTSSLEDAGDRQYVLVLTNIPFAYFELMQGGSNNVIKSMQNVEAGTVTLKVYVNSDDGTLVVAGITGNLNATLPRRTK